MRAPAADYNGVLLVDKPPAHTSHDVVARLRGILKMKRIGHAGTLDPMATGLLIVLLGKATKLSQFLMGADKEYTGTITLGSSTNTQDAEGEVVETRQVPALTEEDIKAALNSMLGDQYQTPPMFSAVKIKGQALYKSARAGVEVEREARFIRVMKFDCTRWASPEIDFVVRSTKGTYVRTLAHDLGQKLGCCAHLSALRRTFSGDFHVDQSVTLEAVQKMTPSEIEAALIPLYKAAPSVALG